MSHSYEDPSTSVETDEVLDGDFSVPVFLDRTGRRWRRIRGGLVILGVVTTLTTLAFILSFLIPQQLPDYHPADQSVVPRFSGTQALRTRLAKREQFYAVVSAGRTAQVLRATARRLERELAGPPQNSKQLRVGFYVTWADPSLVSFTRNASSLDWVVCEWGFLRHGLDTTQFMPDPKFYQVYDSISTKPKILAMVSNFSRDTIKGGGTFDGENLHRVLKDSSKRDVLAAQIVNYVLAHKLAGVTIDFENVVPGGEHEVVAFVANLHRRMAPLGLLVTQSAAVFTTPAVLRQYAAVNDYLFLMLYDEHYGRGDPGPIASQAWYVDRARQALKVLSPSKTIFAIGAYGYDWNDAGPDASGQQYTFQEVMAAGREHASHMGFDRGSLNPYMMWTDPDSTDHLVWYLDAVTAYNQTRVARQLGAAGWAVWRLGAEDPNFWDAVATDNPNDAAKALETMKPGYDPELKGVGELLQIQSEPLEGHRNLTVDTATKLIDGQTIVQYPTPYVVKKYGYNPHRVALTFDDGPDGRWTPMILDTLASRHVKATFFVIGVNVDAHIPLVRRIYREGHLIGNHTYTHPNLARTSPFVTRLEIDANQRLIEAALDRRSLFFRSPYLGDADPTTVDELGPVAVASARGYITVGLRVDGEDWQPISKEQIIRNVLDGLNPKDTGNVVLLHDSGGDRYQTVRALGPLIDSIRARGDTLVLLSDLAGITPEQAMPPLPPRSAATRAVQLATFGAMGVIEWVLYWCFLIAVVVGGIRLALIILIAAVHRFRPRKPMPPYSPSVTIVVPAYNECKVIGSTVQSLLAQEYDGTIEILVVDDGSSDDTYDVVHRDFAGDARVMAYRKDNGGKASALNYGIARAKGEIVVCLDADTVFTPNTVARLVAPMYDTRVAAVAGNAKVGNRHNLITRWQALEYVTSQNLERRAFAVLNAITVVPGAVGAWRKAYVQAVGGFSDDTLAEDQDLTLSLGEEGCRVVYADDAIAYTEAPDRFRTLARQRFRWSFGTLQCAWKHRRIFLRPQYGALGMVAMPNTWIFQLFYTAISPLADLLFLWSLFSVWLVLAQHGPTYAMTNLQQVLFLYAIFLVVDWLAAVIAFWMEPGEDRRLTWLILLQRFAYRQVMYWVVLRAIGAAIRGHVVGWGKLERKGMGLLPTSART